MRRPAELAGESVVVDPREIEDYRLQVNERIVGILPRKPEDIRLRLTVLMVDDEVVDRPENLIGALSPRSDRARRHTPRTLSTPI